MQRAARTGAASATLGLVAELFGLLISLVVLVVLLLPILTFARLGRISRELDELRDRIGRLERGGPVAPPLAPEVERSPPVGVPAIPSVPGAPPAFVAAPSAPVAPDALNDPSAATVPSIEERIGGRGLLYTGVFVMLLGVSFFLKYAFDNEWINETARTLIGLGAGVGLVIGGLRLASSGLATFGHALTGMGFAVLYLVIYAALNFYYLIDRGLAFAGMLAVTTGAAVLSHRQRAQALAAIAVSGGFLTPALVSGIDDTQLMLFTYVGILVIGTMLLSLRHQWPALNAISYIGTFLTVVAWSGRFYTDALWLRTLLFLTLFCVAFLIILRETRRRRSLSARAVSGLLTTAPVFYHVAAVVITAAHPPAIHIYLITVTAAALWSTADPHRPLLRLAVLLAVLVPMFGALTLPDGPSWLLANVITIVAIASLHLMALVDRVTREDESLGGSELLVLHLTVLGSFSLLYETLQPALPGWRGGLAGIVALAAAAVGRAVRARDEIAWLHALALTLTLLAIGTAIQFDGTPVVIGWAAEGAAIGWLGVRMRNRAFQFGGFVLWILATLQLFDMFYETPAGFMVLFNARTLATLFVLTCGYALAARIAASDAAEASRLRTTLHIVASALTLGWITAEIQSFWDVRGETAQAHLYEQMLLSLAWGLYGAALIAVGMWRQFAVLRYIGMTIIGLTLLKVFFYDLWELGGIYRVVGFLGFGVLLVLVSYLYQNRRRADRPQL